MRGQDLTCEDFRSGLFDFLEGILTESSSGFFESHARRCESCRNIRTQSEQVTRLLGKLGEDENPQKEIDMLLLQYRSWLQGNADSSCLAAVADEERLWLELKNEDFSDRRAFIMNRKRFQNPGLCRLLIDRSWEQRAQDPKGYRELAEIAVEISGTIGAPEIDNAEAEDLRALALANLGNAQRIEADLEGAAQSLQRAWSSSNQGSRSPAVRGRILRFQAHLSVAMGRWKEAVFKFERALAEFKIADDDHLVGYTMIEFGARKIEDSDLVGAMSLIEGGLARVDLSRDPIVLLTATHGYVYCLIESGEIHQARRLLPKLRSLHESFSDDLNLLRFEWLVGKVAYGEGRIQQAKALFWKVRKGFIRKHCPLEVALVTLDLSVICADQGQYSELKQLAAEMIVLFRSRRVHREAIAALTLFHKAVEMERLSLEFIKELTEYFQRARMNPDLRFRGRASDGAQIN